jgi:hypothetical protein
MTSLRVRDLEVLLTHRSLCVCGPHETGTPTDLHEQYPDAWSGRAGGERFPRASGPAPSKSNHTTFVHSSGLWQGLLL